MKRREDLTTPRRGRRLPSVHYDPEAFGNFSEGLARYFGTARYLVIQTIGVMVWIALNATFGDGAFDPYPFILLNLLFSTQAAYAAPLILLAQNRQEARDRTVAERDRAMADRTQSDTEFLAREIASVRLALADLVTNSDLDDRLEKITRSLERLTAHLDPQPPPPPEAVP